jgi:hypothetical protein
MLSYIPFILLLTLCFGLIFITVCYFVKCWIRALSIERIGLADSESTRS